MITPDQEIKLRVQLEQDDSHRNRGKYVYAFDALEATSFGRFVIWPESNTSVRGVIDGLIGYNALPFDEGNEIAKGQCFPEQQNVIKRHPNQNPLCEAIELRPCLREKCPLFNTDTAPPVCREYKMVFKKQLKTGSELAD